MQIFMSAVARQHIEEAEDVQAQRLGGKYEGLIELEEDAEEQLFGDLFWEFIADELMVDD